MQQSMLQSIIKDTGIEKMVNILQDVKGIHTSNIEKLRLFLEACVYTIRGGFPWRMLPDCYGDWRSVHKRFKAWSERKVWQRLFEDVQKDPDMESVMVDSTIVRAHACAAGLPGSTQKKEALGRSNGGFTTKIHVLVDALGNPLKFVLTPGQQNDITVATTL